MAYEYLPTPGGVQLPAYPQRHSFRCSCRQGAYALCAYSTFIPLDTFLNECQNVFDIVVVRFLKMYRSIMSKLYGMIFKWVQKELRIQNLESLFIHCQDIY